MSLDVNEMVHRLSNYWWTEAPGPAYVVRSSDGLRLSGPGRIATSEPGNFNIFAALARLREPGAYSFHDYQMRVPLLVVSDFVARQQLDGWDVETWAVLLDFAAFRRFVLERRSQVFRWPWSTAALAVLRTPKDFLEALPQENWSARNSAPS